MYKRQVHRFGNESDNLSDEVMDNATTGIQDANTNDTNTEYNYDNWSNNVEPNDVFMDDEPIWDNSIPSDDANPGDFSGSSNIIESVVKKKRKPDDGTEGKSKLSFHLSEKLKNMLGEENANEMKNVIETAVENDTEETQPTYKLSDRLRNFLGENAIAELNNIIINQRRLRKDPTRSIISSALPGSREIAAVPDVNTYRDLPPTASAVIPESEKKLENEVLELPSITNTPPARHIPRITLTPPAKYYAPPEIIVTPPSPPGGRKKAIYKFVNDRDIPAIKSITKKKRKKSVRRKLKKKIMRMDSTEIMNISNPEDGKTNYENWEDSVGSN